MDFSTTQHGNEFLVSGVGEEQMVYYRELLRYLDKNKLQMLSLEEARVFVGNAPKLENRHYIVVIAEEEGLSGLKFVKFGNAQCAANTIYRGINIKSRLCWLKDDAIFLA